MPREKILNFHIVNFYELTSKTLEVARGVVRSQSSRMTTIQQDHAIFTSVPKYINIIQIFFETIVSK